MGMVIFLTVLLQAKAAISTNEDHHITREVESMKSHITSFLDVRKTSLENMANQPIIIQGALQPHGYIENIKDFIDSQKILKQDYDIGLYDFSGHRIYCEADSESAFESNIHDINYNEWMKDILSGAITYYIGPNLKENQVWILAVPVKYNESVEGILIAEVPISEIFLTHDINKMSEGMQIDIFSGGNLVSSIGDVPIGPQNIERIPEMGLTIHFTMDTSETTLALTRLYTSLILITAAFIIFTIVLLVRLSNKYVVMPLNDIGRLAMQLANGDKNFIFIHESAVLELQELTQQFLTMSDKIDDREIEILAAQAKIQVKNKVLKKTLSQLEETQGQMYQQEKLASIGHLAAGVAHELNNPIGFVNSNFTVLREYFEDLTLYFNHLHENYGVEADNQLENGRDIAFILEDIPDLLSDSQEGLDRVTSIVKNLRYFSRIDSFEQSDYDLNEGIRSTLIIAGNEYKYVADVETNLAKLPTIIAKGSDINDVLLNLIVNASHAIETLNLDENGLIQIESYVEDKYVCVKISDNGPGVHESIIERIFDPFFTTKDPGKGTGLGLNIAYNTIVKKHGGDLQVFSNFGEGATFIIKLPIERTRTFTPSDNQTI